MPQDYRIEDLADLTSAERHRRLDAFVRDIYRPSFPRDEHRDDPAVWRELLDERPPPPSPLFTILLALRDEAVAGGIVLEYFRQSRSGLITYIAVAPQERGHGLGKLLLQSAVDALTHLAANAGHPPPPVFAETEDPRVLPDHALEAGRRQQVLAALGFLTCDLPYLQPPLRQGESPSRGLQLCAMASTLDGESSVPSSRVKSFLQDFYASLPPGASEALESMETWLGGRDRVRFHRFKTEPGEA